MNYKSKIRREKREKQWIFEMLDEDIKLFLKDIFYILEKIHKSKNKIHSFYDALDIINDHIDSGHIRWKRKCNNIRDNRKKHIVPFIDLFQKRAKYITLRIILIDYLKLGSDKLDQYFPEGLFEKEEEIIDIFEAIICEQLVRKEKSKSNYTELPKKNYFLKIWLQVSYSVSSVVKRLFFQKN